MKLSIGEFEVRAPSLGGWKRILTALTDADVKLLADLVDGRERLVGQGAAAAVEALLPLAVRAPDLAALYLAASLWTEAGPLALSVDGPSTQSATADDVVAVVLEQLENGSWTAVRGALGNRLRLARETPAPA